MIAALLLFLSLCADCQRNPEPQAMVAILTYDYRIVTETRINDALRTVGIQGVTGEGGRVWQFLVPADRATEARDLLKKSNLPGLTFLTR